MRTAAGESGNKKATNVPYKDSGLSSARRVKDLLSRMQIKWCGQEENRLAIELDNIRRHRDRWEQARGMIYSGAVK
jgi:hypothetical protein